MKVGEEYKSTISGKIFKIIDIDGSKISWLYGGDSPTYISTYGASRFRKRIEQGQYVLLSMHPAINSSIDELFL